MCICTGMDHCQLTFSCIVVLMCGCCSCTVAPTPTPTVTSATMKAKLRRRCHCQHCRCCCCKSKSKRCLLRSDRLNLTTAEMKVDGPRWRCDMQSTPSRELRRDKRQGDKIRQLAA